MITNMIDYTFSIVDLEYFLLILTRVSCFVYIAPFFGMSNTPRQIKVGLSFFIAILLYYSVMPKQYPEYYGIVGYALVVLKEAATGLIIGFGAQICISITNFAGRLVDMEIGLAMVNQLDPTTKEQTTITGVFYQYFVMLILIISGFHQYLIKALAETFTLIPINGAVFKYESLVANVVEFIRDYIIIGFQICLPIFAAILLLNTILGILAKVAPQLNMFAVGIQLKIITGLVVLLLSVSLLPIAADFIFEKMKYTIVSFVESMM